MPVEQWATHALAGGLGPDLPAQLTGAITVGTGARIQVPVHAPFTGESLGTVPSCTPEDVATAVKQARDAQPGWAATSFHQRRAILLRFHDLLLERQSRVMDLIQLESGKARAHALEEVLDTALVARHYAIHAEKYLRTRRHLGAIPLLTSAWEIRHPIGVVGFITPWNFPLVLSVTDLIPALMAGNAVVLRPDLQSPFTALWAAQLLYEAGLPRDVLQIVTGPGSVVGCALIDRADFVMFTGSTRTGRVVARQAGERLIGYSLELGGKNPMIVLEDADFEAAADGCARGAFVGAGQVCISIERVYVPEKRMEEFCEALVQRTGRIKLGPEGDMGSLTSSDQLATVSAHVQDAIHKGARLLTGGRPRPDLGPYFYEPTVLRDVTPAMKLFAEETFGPVVSIYPYGSIEDAIRLANDTPYGLNASVWSRNITNAKTVARQIRAGTVNINEVYAATWSSTRSPIGGMRDSGLGRRHGAEGILKYTETQTIAVQRLAPLAPPPSMRQETYAKLMTTLLKLTRHIPLLR